MRNFIIIALVILSVSFVGCTTKAQPMEQTASEINQEFVPICPRGIVEEPYPGSCGIYQDADSNHICDLSEPQ